MSDIKLEKLKSLEFRMHMTQKLLVFFQEVFGELKKIHWPDRSKFIFSTISTLIIVVIFSVLLFFIDGLIGHVVKFVMNKFV